MAKKDKNKNSEAELKADDIITTDQDESFNLNEEQAASLNEQMKVGVEESKDESTPPASKKMEKAENPVNGTARFIKLNSN